MKGLNTTDFKTSFFLNFSKIKLLLKTDEDLRSSLELGIFFKILDQVFTENITMMNSGTYLRKLEILLENYKKIFIFLFF